MTDEIVNTSVSDVESSNDESQNQSVSYDAHRKLLNQRKADQAKARELEEKYNALRAEREAEAEARMIEEKRFKELYEAKQAELESMQNNMTQMEQSVQETLKLQAFRQHVGELANPLYASLIDLSAIKMDETGNIDKESLDAYGASFKEAHSHLLKTSKVSHVASSNAPKGTIDLPEAEKYAGLSQKEINKLKLKEAREKFYQAKLGK